MNTAGVFALYGFAAVGAVVSLVGLVITAAIVVLPVRDRLRAARMRRLEQVRPIGDPAQDQLFGDLAEALLDDPADPRLPDVCEREGWMQ